jgi:copper chaperone CopZ
VEGSLRRDFRKEDVMKTKVGLVLVLLLGLFLLSCAYQQAKQPLLGTEKIVQLTVPTCDWPGTAQRIRYILGKTEGVRGVKTDHLSHTVTVTFDDKRVGVEQMVNVLKKDGFQVKGSPKYLN